MGILAFKGFESDLTCRGFQYEVGKTYSLPEGEKPVLCENGFHASLSLRDTFNFYPPDTMTYEPVISYGSLFDKTIKERLDNRYCVVELDGFGASSFWAVNGATAQASPDKFCAAQITIKEELPPLSDFDIDKIRHTIKRYHTPHALIYIKDCYKGITACKFFKKNEMNGLWYECSGTEEGAVSSEEFWDGVFDISSLLELSFASRKIPGL